MITNKIKDNIRHNEQCVDSLELKENLLLEQLADVKKEINFYKSQNVTLTKLLKDKSAIVLKSCDDSEILYLNMVGEKKVCYYHISTNLVVNYAGVKYNVLKKYDDYLIVKLVKESLNNAC